jgi:hypothetical protein
MFGELINNNNNNNNNILQCKLLISIISVQNKTEQKISF